MKPYNRTTALILIATLLCAMPVGALEVKDFTFSHLGKAEGVDNQRIFSVCQTTSGAIWWSSMMGVGRYNGSKVRNYRLDQGTPYGHLGGRVIHLATDSAVIYAFDNRGTIYTFSSLRDRFEPLVSLSKLMGHEVALNDLYAKGNKLYLAMHDGVYVMNAALGASLNDKGKMINEKGTSGNDKGKMINDKEGVTLVQKVKEPYVNRIVPMRDRLLFCAREGVYDERGRRLLPYNTESGYYDDLSGRLWIGGYENGLHLVTLSAEGKVTADTAIDIRWTMSDERCPPIRSICPYDDETMLVGIDGEGVYQMRRDGQGDCTLLFDANQSEHGVLHGNGVYSIVVDTWKNIVIGTYSGGIDIARPIGSTTAIYRHVANDSQSLPNDHVNTVMSLSFSQLLMGTDNGISILNTQTGHWQHCCQGTVVLGASQKPDGSVLVATYGKGVYEIDPQAHVRHVYTTANSPLTDDHVYATFHDRDGGLWVGSLNGDLLHHTPNGSRRYPVHDVQAITQLPTGQIAVGTAFGLKLVTAGSDTVRELNYAPSGITDVNPFVTHLLASGLQLWIATDGGGVYVYHWGKKESRQLTTANGLPSNYVRSLVKGRDGRIWLATDEGLSFVTSDQPDTVHNVNYCYGLHREYSRGAAQSLPDGDILFGTTTGAVVIHPENVQPINYIARLSILGVSCAVGQEALQSQQVAEQLDKGELHLSYRQRTFDLLFESVNMRNHFDIAYRYRVGQGAWSQPSDQQYIRFVDVAPGEHQLTLQCISRTSGAIIDTKTLTILIAQPWWNTWWMWCIYIALILLAFYGAWRIYKLQEKYMRLTIDFLQLSQQKPESDEAQPTSVENVQEIQSLAHPSEPVPQEEPNGNREFVDKATKLILQRLSDSDFSIDQLCREMAMSRTLFYVKLKSCTGKSPQDFIRIIRLERAATMLRSGHNVTDAATLTGFDNPKYFSTVFKKYFGVSPSKYQ